MTDAAAAPNRPRRSTGPGPPGSVPRMSTADSLRDRRPVRRVVADEDAPADSRKWPASIPAVAQVLREGLELVAHWRRYLEEPMRYLRHVIEPD